MFVMRWWYPRLWDTWARENTSEGIEFPFSYKQERLVAEGEDRIEMRSYDSEI